MSLDVEKLKKLLKEKKTTRRELSQAASIPLGSINHWFCGRSPRPIYILAVARALGVPPARITR